ncbi:TlpA disulfide reductase family protein [Flavobacterium sp. DG1-102-2]|uniref:TlpA family protein disulfide reductase n=1 Tax=Flavobacterium sp. DG1-102-2 TaxID=3081663 RepID=UPI00294A2606|nr:TlpA disulfide reductase family protein [Flavobacterium sp. DG1-102-2]MDV6169052.1 TlpA disulfide reductase family protein [Flavobacterium sp. DG1-102-2]
MRTRTIKMLLCCFVMAMSLFTATSQNDTKNLSLPDFEMKLHNNTTVNLSQLKGKVVLLDFWYRGCAPCLMAIPDLVKLQEEFKDDLVIIGINHSDTQDDVIDYFNYKKPNYASTYKNGDNIPKALNVTIIGYPTTMLYGKQGKLIKMDAGYRKGGIRSLRNGIKKALKK